MDASLPPPPPSPPDFNQSTSLTVPPKISAIGTLKKKEEIVLFKDLVIYSPVQHWKSNFSERMRFLDSIRLYSCKPQEMAELNTTSDRLSLHTSKSVMFLCGANRALRFSSEEILFIHAHTQKLANSYLFLDNVYHSHTKSAVKKLTVPSFCHLAANPMYASYFTKQLQLQDIQSLDFNQFIVIYSPKESSELISANAMKVSSGSESGEISPDALAMIKFHVYADFYSYQLHVLQQFIVSKQVELSSVPASSSGFKVGSDPDGTEGKGRKFPEWFDTLVEVYKTRRRVKLQAEHFILLGCSIHDLPELIIIRDSNPVTLGKLSACIALCIVGLITCDKDNEKWALQDVVQASADAASLFRSDSQSVDAKAVATTEGKLDSVDQSFRRRPEYWSSRIFKFISSMKELSSFPKDEDYKHRFDYFV